MSWPLTSISICFITCVNTPVTDIYRRLCPIHYGEVRFKLAGFLGQKNILLHVIFAEV
jgi:hypothetical protein